MAKTAKYDLCITPAGEKPLTDLSELGECLVKTFKDGGLSMVRVQGIDQRDNTLVLKAQVALGDAGHFEGVVRGMAKKGPLSSGCVLICAKL